MAQELRSNPLEGNWTLGHLPGVLVGDVAAAAISATAVSPLITAIDRYVSLRFRYEGKDIEANKSNIGL